MDSKQSAKNIETIDSLTRLISNNVDYGRYLFRKIVHGIHSDEISVISLISQKNHNLLILEDSVIKRASIIENSSKIIPDMFRVNYEVISKRVHSQFDKEMNSFFSHTINVMKKYAEQMDDIESTIDSITLIGQLCRSNLVNVNFKTSIKSLYTLSVKSVETSNYKVHKAISNELGWIIFEGIDCDNIQDDQIIKGFEYLTDFFVKCCDFSTMEVKRFVGTALMLNYINLYIDSKRKRIEDQIKRIFASLATNDSYREIMVDSVKLREAVMDDYFDKRVVKAKKCLDEYKVIIKF